MKCGFTPAFLAQQRMAFDVNSKYGEFPHCEWLDLWGYGQDRAVVIFEPATAAV
jgi:hypothetical protein